ncbi:MAG: glycosyltransferase [Planctomycetota bacterium]
MKKSPPVTVLIPAFNCVEYLEETVQSVLSQTYSGAKTIHILDDGSTDGTSELIQRLVNSHPTISSTCQDNAGRGETRDRLLRTCPTEVSAWIDSDDVATPNWLRDQIQCLCSNSTIAAVSGQAYAMTREWRPIAPLPSHPLTHHDIAERHLSGHANAFYQSCTVIRRDAAIAAGGYRRECFASEDYDLWLRLAEYGRLQNVDEVHLFYRVHDTSANASLSSHQRSQGFELVNEARRRCGRMPLSTPPFETPSPKKDDWNRRVFWINRAMRAGNHWTACVMSLKALRRHPLSFLLLATAIINSLDAILCGNAMDASADVTPKRDATTSISGTESVGPATRAARFFLRLYRRYKLPGSTAPRSNSAPPADP